MKHFKKKVIIACCGFVSVLFAALSVRSSASVAVMADNVKNGDVYPTVVIDPGHGGEDGGASSETGLLEKNINLDISLYLRGFLESSGFRVVMTRDKDEQIYDENCNNLRDKKVSDTHNRLNICNKIENCIYVSVHQNIFTDSKYSGAQVFYSPNLAESKILAESIRCSIVNLLQPENKRAIKSSDENIYILHNAKNPCVLVECGFLSNYNESVLLSTDRYKKQMAFSVYLGIMDYCYNNY